MNNLLIKKTEAQKEIEGAFGIRKKVFVEEQGIDAKADRDGLDDEADHIIASLNGNVISCARVRFINGKAKLERIATLKECRRKGYGSQMINFLIEYCKGKEAKEIYFDAQLHAKEFYEKFGFRKRGDVFEEVGVPHVEMYLGVLN